MNKKLLAIGAVIILACALVFNFYAQHQANLELNKYYDILLASGNTYEPIATNTVKVLDDGQLVGFAGMAEYNGFGGPMLVGVVTDTKGTITKLEILAHKETPQYLTRIAKDGFFEQYKDKNIDTGMKFGEDIDGISAATLSTRAIAMCADEVAESIRVNGLNLPPHVANIPWQIGLAEIVVAGIISLVVVLTMVPSLRRLRPVLLIVSVVAIGFWLNRPVAISHISSVFMGYFPVLKTNLIWYLMLAVALLPPIVMGKNYYCTYLCPFGAATEGIHFVGKKANLPLTKKVPFLHKTRMLIVFVALLVAFLFQNPSVSSFEPFATLFSRQGTGIQWMLLGTILVASVFFKRFWCTGFCPIGGFLDIIASFRRKLGRMVKKEAKVANQQTAAAHEATAQPPCAGGELSKKEKLAEGLYKLFYAIIIFSVVVAIFEKWAII